VSNTKTGLQAFEETIFIVAKKNNKTLKTIELYSFQKTYFGDEVKAANVILPQRPLNIFEMLHDGQDVFLSKNEVSNIINQVDNITIFSKTYKD
jgi:hypothetical protein